MLDVAVIVIIYYLPRGAPRKGRDGGAHAQGAQRGEQRRGAEILLFKYFHPSDYYPPPRDGEPLRGCRRGARSGGDCGARWAGGSRAGVDIVDIYLVCRYLDIYLGVVEGVMGLQTVQSVQQRGRGGVVRHTHLSR